MMFTAYLSKRRSTSVRPATSYVTTSPKTSIPRHRRRRSSQPTVIRMAPGVAGASKPPCKEFEDIFGTRGYDFPSAAPQPLNETHQRNMDPEELKVLRWTGGNTLDIRALLRSLHTVLWAGAKWSQLETRQLVTAADVKRTYHRACLAVHPDKQMGTPNENIARLLFVELNNAWSEFEQQQRA